MAYQTGVTTDSVDLLQKLIAFLQADGWTVNKNEAAGTHWRAHILKDGLYVNLYASKGNGAGWCPWQWQAGDANANTGALHLYVGTGYNGGAAWYAQGGGPVNVDGTGTVGSAMVCAASGMGNYHLFSNGDCVAVFAEATPGFWTHCGWGNLKKAGAYTGGAYFFGSAHPANIFNEPAGRAGYNVNGYTPTGADSCAWGGNSYVRADVDTWVNKWLSTGVGFGVGRLAPSGAYGGFQTPQEPSSAIAGTNGLAYRVVASITGQVTLLPIRIFASRDASPGGYSLLGTVPDVFEAHHAYSAGTLMAIGADDYVLFPNCAVRKVA